MRRIAAIFLLTYYTLGTFCLPMGNFAALQDLPEMYRHCKATEHHDMTQLDFVTDHLLNIDGIFDDHGNGDEQKPHQPFQAQHNGQIIISFVAYFSLTLVNFDFVTEKLPQYADNFFPSEYVAKIFRPPIA